MADRKQRLRSLIDHAFQPFLHCVQSPRNLAQFFRTGGIIEKDPPGRSDQLRIFRQPAKGRAQCTDKHGGGSQDQYGYQSNPNRGFQQEPPVGDPFLRREANPCVFVYLDSANDFSLKVEE